MYSKSAAFVCAIFLACLAVAANPEVKIDDAQAALERLVLRTNPDAFLIISETTTGKFVQFSHHPEHGIGFDLPVDSLSEEEQRRASRLLIAQGAELLSWQAGGSTMQAYSQRLRTDTLAAFRLAESVMHDVYGFGMDARYSLVEN